MNNNILNYIKELSKKDKKSLSKKVAKLFEEGGELARKSLPYDDAAGTLHRFTVRESILEEVADVILVALSIGYDLDMTDNELFSIMQKKASYWDQLQTSEKLVKDSSKIPFEIHITIDQNKLTGIDAFRFFCSQIGVKATILELFDLNFNSIGFDFMTSSIHKGTNATVMNECLRISNALTSAGYDVIRTKIETVPWHPMAPSAKNDRKMPEGCYFEHHVNVKDWPISLPFSNILHLENELFNTKIRISDNIKKKTETTYIRSITLRNDSRYFETFVADVAHVKEELERLGLILEEDNNIEFAIYDSNLAHDGKWMDK